MKKVRMYNDPPEVKEEEQKVEGSTEVASGTPQAESAAPGTDDGSSSSE